MATKKQADLEPQKRFVYLIQGAKVHEMDPPLHESDDRDVMWLTYKVKEGSQVPCPPPPPPSPPKNRVEGAPMRAHPQGCHNVYVSGPLDGPREGGGFPPPLGKDSNIVFRRKRFLPNYHQPLDLRSAGSVQGVPVFPSFLSKGHQKFARGGGGGRSENGPPSPRANFVCFYYHMLMGGNFFCKFYTPLV